jgi:hypothetical protein
LRRSRHSVTASPLKRPMLPERVVSGCTGIA